MARGLRKPTLLCTEVNVWYQTRKKRKWKWGKNTEWRATWEVRKAKSRKWGEWIEEELNEVKRWRKRLKKEFKKKKEEESQQWVQNVMTSPNILQHVTTLSNFAACNLSLLSSLVCNTFTTVFSSSETTKTFASSNLTSELQCSFQVPHHSLCKNEWVTPVHSRR